VRKIDLGGERSDFWVSPVSNLGPDKDVAYTDLRMDWGDACSLGRNGEQYFLCRVITTLPKEYRKVTNKSFGPRYAEGIYLHSDSVTPSVWMFDMISKTTIMVSDFKAYHDQFPMCDPTCLVSAAFSHKDVQAMHTEDAVDDTDLAAHPAPPLTRSRAHSLTVPLPAAQSVPTTVPIPDLPKPPPPVSIFDQTFFVYDWPRPSSITM
jgi:hypothetical protein